MNENTSADQKKLILVVEDNDDLRMMLGQLLERTGYRVALADDGPASLIQAKQHHPDLIMMDLSLPYLDGWEAVELLRKMPEFRITPIIAVTAHVSSAERERSLAIGCTVHIGKPFRIKVLLQSIAEQLSIEKSAKEV